MIRVESRVPCRDGCPSIDIAASRGKPALDFDPFEKYGGVGPKADLSRGYLVVMQHPVTTEYDEARAQVDETLYAVAGLGLPVLWFWPNVDAGSDGTSKGIRMFREHQKPDSSTCSGNVPRRPELLVKAPHCRQLQRGDSRVCVLA